MLESNFLFLTFGVNSTRTKSINVVLFCFELFAVIQINTLRCDSNLNKLNVLVLHSILSAFFFEQIYVQKQFANGRKTLNVYEQQSVLL